MFDQQANEAPVARHWAMINEQIALPIGERGGHLTQDELLYAFTLTLHTAFVATSAASIAGETVSWAVLDDFEAEARNLGHKMERETREMQCKAEEYIAANAPFCTLEDLGASAIQNANDTYIDLGRRERFEGAACHEDLEYWTLVFDTAESLVQEYGNRMDPTTYEGLEISLARVLEDAEKGNAPRAVLDALNAASDALHRVTPS